MPYSSDLQNHLQEWVKTASGYDGSKVIWESVNAPRPDRPYISLAIPSAELQGQPDLINIGNGQIQIRNDLIFTFTINAFSADNSGQEKDAIALLWELYLSIGKQAIQDLFNEYKLGFLGMLSNFDLTQLLSTEFEQRATMDLSFMTGIEIIDDVGWIEKVTGTGTVDGRIIDYEVELPTP